MRGERLEGETKEKLSRIIRPLEPYRETELIQVYLHFPFALTNYERKTSPCLVNLFQSVL